MKQSSNGSSVEPYYTLPKAAELLGIPKYSLRRAVNIGRIPAYKLVGNRWMVRISDIEAAITAFNQGGLHNG